MMEFLRSFLNGGVDGAAAAVPASTTDPVPATNYGVAVVLTTTPLAAAGVYTSPAIDCGASPSRNAALVFIASADQSGSFVFQASDDGSTWYTYATVSAVSASGANSSTNLGCARYVRFVYTNGGVDQTKFRLAYILK